MNRGIHDLWRRLRGNDQSRKRVALAVVLIVAKRLESELERAFEIAPVGSASACAAEASGRRLARRAIRAAG